jgi:peptidoglycan/xylan/chitin deacetylase (PgdA/CDA1 family)
MFNVYEGGEIVEDILDILKNYDAKATFFIGGCWADDNEDLLIKILEQGHEIGSHGYFHKDHSKLSEEENRQEMTLLHTLVKRVTGYEIKLFAPPSGSFSIATLKIAENLGYKTIMWSKDTIDWRDKSSKIVYNRATKNIIGGDLVLMHPKKHTLEALPNILEYYKEQKLLAVTVSECIG